MRVGVDTNELPEAKRLDLWRGIMCDTYVGVDCQVAEEGFRSVIDGHSAGDHTFTRSISSGHLVDRSRTLIKRDGLERVFFGIALAGRTIMMQGDRETVVEPGMIAFNDSTRPFRTYFVPGSDTLWLGVPKRSLTDRVKKLEDLTAIAFHPSKPVHKIALDMMAGLDEAAGHLPPHEADSLAVQMLELLAMSIMTSASAFAEGSGEGSRPSSH